MKISLRGNPSGKAWEDDRGARKKTQSKKILSSTGKPMGKKKEFSGLQKSKGDPRLFPKKRRGIGG